MRILFIAPSAFTSTPHAHEVLTLAKVLRRADHAVDLVSPLFGQVDTKKLALARRLTKLEFELGGRPWACEIYTGRNPDGVELTFIGNEEVLLPAQALEAEGEQLAASRAGVFAAAVVELVREHQRDFDVVHAHGWPGALALLRLRDELPQMPSVLTIFDASEQGRFDRRDATWLGLEGEAEGDVNVLERGIRSADRVVTLSPNYAHRLKREGEGMGLEEAVREAGDKLGSVRHGIDPALWNPATDRHLPARFDPFDLTGKEECKAEIQRNLALPVRSDVPLFVASGEIDSQGMELLATAAGEFLRNDVQLVVHLRGDGKLVAVYEELWDEWPDRIQIKTGEDEEFRHVLIAASDFVVTPELEAPGDNLQMLAQRYGGIPIACREGSFADEIVDVEASLQTGSGLLYDESTPNALLAALQRAAAAFANTKAFSALQSRVMRIDHSWERTIRLYERIYKDAINKGD